MAKAMIVAGVMSGTSADGVDVAICRISGEHIPKLKLLGHTSIPYPKAVRGAVLAAMDAKSASVADLSRLNWRLGAIYADCVERAASEMNVKVALVGCHGQTLYHQGAPAKYLGASMRATWQAGEPSVLVERLRVPVVSDFRPADLAAGGQGAPLVPMLDYTIFRSAKINRVLQNLGGIGNLTALPAGCSVDGIMAFDTGPGNMVIDACMQRLYGKAFDRGGRTGRQGRVLDGVVREILREQYFSAPPPKSCGREEFGASFTDRFIDRCRIAGARDVDVIATATSLTAASILEAYRRFVWAHLGQMAPIAKTEYVVAGGGAKNATLLEMLRRGFEPLGVKLRLMEDFGIPSQAKEGVAFALLAWLTWHRRPGNVSAATGANRPVILGKVSF